MAAEIVLPFLSKIKYPFFLCSSIPALRARRRGHRFSRQLVGFVPTMGALHQGHLALIRQAAEETDRVYVSIYVNPTQFGANEDLSSYPRTLRTDYFQLERLAKELKSEEARGRIDTIFMPTSQDMYPGLPPSSEVDGDGSFVTITPLSRRLEGASRPIFFRGVATVVMKLLNIVQPDFVYFGQKDIQQTFVIKRMVEDFHIDTAVVVGPTVRENDGLAMSSRNIFLGDRRRKVAIVLLRALKEIQHVFARGVRKRSYLYQAANSVLAQVQRQQEELPPKQRALFEIDYISIADPKTLEELDEVTSEDGAIISGAIKMLPIEEPQEGEKLGEGGDTSTVRLIDNIKLDLLSAKIGMLS